MLAISLAVVVVCVRYSLERRRDGDSGPLFWVRTDLARSRSLSRKDRQEIARAVRAGRAVDNPLLAPHAIAMVERTKWMPRWLFSLVALVFVALGTMEALGGDWLLGGVTIAFFGGGWIAMRVLSPR